MIDKTDPTNRDTVPAMLTPGEFVLNKEASTMFAPVIEQMNAAGLQHRAMKNMGGGIPTYNKGGDVKPSLQQGIAEAAAALGVDPIDLATIISYETAGTLSPTQKGPTTKWGQHRGYIQFGEPQAKEYGVDFSSEDSAMSSQLGANGAIVKYFKAHGFEPGMGLMDLYSIVNAGGPGRYNWSDEKAGGAKGTVADKVIKQMPAHRDKAIKLLGVNFAPETSVRPQSRGDVPSQATPQLTAQANPIAVEQAIMQASVPQVQAAPPVPTDFGEAFKDARADMGAGGIFTFRGRDYTTDYAEEDKTMTANMGGSVYLNMGGYPQEYLDNYRKAIMANMGPEYLARIERIVSKDAARELQAQVRPDYTPGNIEEGSASSEPMAYNDPALKARSDGEIDLRLSDRMLDKNLYLSQPGTGMTTEESIAKRKNLASNSYVPMPEVNSDDPVTNPSSRFGSSLEYNYDTYLKEMGYNDVPAVREMWRRYQDKMNAKSAEVPMPEVNSDESLLQGSSGSVASAARSFPSDYPINMDVPRVEGYNIPAPIPAPRPTMIGGQLYYLNGDGLVTDSNGNPVQDPEIGAAVQDKLNYSPEESAANAQAYNESMAEQAVLNGTNPQSVNPSYDSMRQQQESNAAEAERIRAEVAQIAMERQALNDEFNNREPVVVPPLETGPLVLEGFVPDVPAYEGELGGLMPPYEGELGGGNMPLMREDIVQSQQILNPYDFNPYGNDPMGEIPKLENSDGYTNEELRVLSNTDNAAGSPWAEILQERTERQASELRSELQEAANNGIVPTQSSLNQLSDLERQSRNASEVKAVNDQVVAANQESVATTKAALGATERERRLRAIERAAEYGITVGDGSSGASEDVTAKVEGIINNLPEDDKKTSKGQDLAAKEAAAAEEARLTQAGGGDAKNTPEVKGAMSAIKSMFGDLFDTKELLRAAILYLGGRATGLNGNQALAFAGKNYLARVDAKEGTYQKIALEGKHTKESLAIFKKSMDFGDLVTKDLPAVPTGEFKTMYDRKTGREITLTEKKVGDGSYWFDGNKQVDVRTLTNDGRFAPKTAANITYKNTIRGNVESLVTSLDALNPSKNKDAKAGTSELGIAKETIGREAVTFAIENGMELEQMEELVEKAYKEALVDARSGKKISRLSDYFSRAWVESNTTDAQNFFLPGKTKDGKPIPVPVANVTTFLQTIKKAAAASGKQELANMSDTQVSSWLMSTESYKAWQTMDPELKKEYIKTGAASGRSGMMEYILSGMVS